MHMNLDPNRKVYCQTLMNFNDLPNSQKEFVSSFGPTKVSYTSIISKTACIHSDFVSLYRSNPKTAHVILHPVLLVRLTYGVHALAGVHVDILILCIFNILGAVTLLWVHEQTL